MCWILNDSLLSIPYTVIDLTVGFFCSRVDLPAFDLDKGNNNCFFTLTSFAFKVPAGCKLPHKKKPFIAETIERHQ